MSLRPAQQIDHRGGDVINLATSTPVNSCDRTAASRRAAVNVAACICACRSVVQASVKQNLALAINTVCPQSREPAAAPSTMTGALLTGDREELGCGSELGRQVAVDLEADANLNKDRGRPRHGTLHEIL
jgi:hypothetical protein